MKKFLLLLAFVAIGISVAAQGGPPNTLTAKEKAEGWKLLFDGTTLNDFVPQGKAPWKVVDGALRPEVAGGWLATKDDYANFQLQVEFRTSAPNINSGIYIRRARQDGDSHLIGYELQIRNPSPGDKPFDGKEGNHNAYYTGSFSGHMKSKNEPTVIMGQWHHYDLTAQGDHFVVMFDGKKVLDARHPEFKSGAIGLQRTGPNTSSSAASRSSRSNHRAGSEDHRGARRFRAPHSSITRKVTSSAARHGRHLRHCHRARVVDARSTCCNCQKLRNNRPAPVNSATDSHLHKP